jgi:hypothetical protein
MLMLGFTVAVGRAPDSGRGADGTIRKPPVESFAMR